MIICKISKERLVYAFLTVFISAMVSISVYHLWGTDLRVPLSGYRSDSLGVLLELNNYVRGGSVHNFVIYGGTYENTYINNGFGDSSVPMFLLKLIWRITGSVEESVNIHAVLNAVFLSLSMYWVCIRLKIRSIFSLLSGVLYGNLSYFVLGANTVLLVYGACFYIPLFCYILIELMRTDSQLDNLEIGNTVFILAVMLYMGMNSAYYAFLGMILLAFVMVYTLFVKKNVNSVLLVFLCFFSIGLGIVTYTLPSMLARVGADSVVIRMGYWLQVLVALISIMILLGMILLLKRVCKRFTMNTIYKSIFGFAGIAGIAYVLLWRYTDYLGSYAGRSLVDVQLGSLKAGSMVLPAVNSVFGIGRSILSAITDIDNLQASDIAEIGVLAGVGFVYSIIMIFQYKENKARGEILKVCGLIHCFILAVASKGGLSLLIGAFLTTGIRGYSRMCVYIAAFGLISFAILMDQIIDRVKSVSFRIVRCGMYVLVMGILGLGVVMSIPTDFIYQGMFGFVSYDQRKEEYDEWQRYIGDIESEVSSNGMILELPLYIDDVHMGELMTAGRAYELSIPAVVSKTTCWNDGGAHKKAFNNILNTIDSMDDFLTLTGACGYDGIYIDSMMYHNDFYLEIREELEKYLGEPLICSKGRRYFYSLTEYNQKLQEQYTEEELQMVKEKLIRQWKK